MKRTLYKYFPLTNDAHLQRLERLLQGWIYFSSPDHFNDPFEISPVLAPPTREDFDDVIDLVSPEVRMLSKSARSKVFRGITDAIRSSSSPAVTTDWMKSVGVLCLSTQPEDLLMWAHYASNHSGLCVGFDSDVGLFGSARGVKYSNERPLVRAIDLSRNEDALIDGVLFTKSLHWKYEAEWRCLKRPVREGEIEYYQSLLAAQPHRENEIADILATEGGSGNYEFDVRAIRRVYFGARMQATHREKLRQLLGSLTPLAKPYQMELDPRYFRLNVSKKLS